MRKITANLANWHQGVELWYGRLREGESVWEMAQPIVMKRDENPNARLSPFITLENAEAQALIDELWRCGFRPTEGTGSAGSLAATERHLQDMRTLVFEGRPANDPTREQQEFQS